MSRQSGKFCNGDEFHDDDADCSCPLLSCSCCLFDVEKEEIMFCYVIINLVFDDILSVQANACESVIPSTLPSKIFSSVMHDRAFHLLELHGTQF